MRALALGAALQDVAGDADGSEGERDGGAFGRGLDRQVRKAGSADLLWIEEAADEAAGHKSPLGTGGTANGKADGGAGDCRDGGGAQGADSGK